MRTIKEKCLANIDERKRAEGAGRLNCPLHS